MLARVLAWLELKSWQAAVGAMSAARPLSARVIRTAQGIKQVAASLPKQIEFEPPAQLRGQLHNRYSVAAAGWLLGLALGYLLSAR